MARATVGVHMILFRSLLYQFVLIGSTLAYSLMILAVGEKRDRVVSRLGRSWGHVNLRALKWICGLDFRVSGLERFASQPGIVLAKHQSAWETIAFRALLPVDQSWVLKQELTRIPIFGKALQYFKPIAIDRSAGRKEISKLIRNGGERLSEGRWVIVFPEGTRVAPGKRHPYGIGGALLAERTGHDVIPIVHNAGVFWGRRSFLKRPGVIDVVIGPMISVTGRRPAEINALAEEWIETTLETLPSC
jgi:1-acyl-sn-glycerol-3-phosphate acyltransferase